MTKRQRDLKTFMLIAQECAIADEKLMRTTPALKQRASQLVEFARNRLAEVRRADRTRVNSKSVATGPAQVISSDTEDQPVRRRTPSGWEI